MRRIQTIQCPVGAPIAGRGQRRPDLRGCGPRASFLTSSAETSVVSHAHMHSFLSLSFSQKQQHMIDNIYLIMLHDCNTVGKAGLWKKSHNCVSKIGQSNLMSHQPYVTAFVWLFCGAQKKLFVELSCKRTVCFGPSIQYSFRRCLIAPPTV